MSNQRTPNREALTNRLVIVEALNASSVEKGGSRSGPKHFQEQRANVSFPTMFPIGIRYNGAKMRFCREKG